MSIVLVHDTMSPSTMITDPLVVLTFPNKGLGCQKWVNKIKIAYL